MLERMASEVKDHSRSVGVWAIKEGTANHLTRVMDTACNHADMKGLFKLGKDLQCVCL